MASCYFTYIDVIVGVLSCLRSFFQWPHLVHSIYDHVFHPLYPLVIKHEWRFLARKITYFYGPFSSKSCWIPGGYRWGVLFPPSLERFSLAKHNRCSPEEAAARASPETCTLDHAKTFDWCRGTYINQWWTGNVVMLPSAELTVWPLTIFS